MKREMTAAGAEVDQCRREAGTNWALKGNKTSASVGQLSLWPEEAPAETFSAKRGLTGRGNSK